MINTKDMTKKAVVSKNKTNSSHSKKEINYDQKIFYGQGYAKNSCDEYFKKQEQNQHMSYQNRNKLPNKEVFYGQRLSKNSLKNQFFQQKNQQFLYHRRNKLQVQKVNYEQRHSKNSFEKFLNKQNQQFLY